MFLQFLVFQPPGAKQLNSAWLTCSVLVVHCIVYPQHASHIWQKYPDFLQLPCGQLLLFMTGQPSFACPEPLVLLYKQLAASLCVFLWLIAEYCHWFLGKIASFPPKYTMRFLSEWNLYFLHLWLEGICRGCFRKVWTKVQKMRSHFEEWQLKCALFISSKTPVSAWVMLDLHIR